MTTDEDRYFSIEDGPDVEMRVKASRFLARAFRADDGAAAESALAGVRRRWHDATHHCWASRTGPPGDVAERMDDDGEPGGTAGAPILAAIAGRHLHDTLVVVTRWFGGTKLGTGGLVRAYGGAAHAALEAAPRRELWRVARFVAVCPWPDVGAVEAVLSRAGPDVRHCDREFGSGEPRFGIVVAKSRASDLEDALREATAGRVRIGT